MRQKIKIFYGEHAKHFLSVIQMNDASQIRYFFSRPIASSSSSILVLTLEGLEKYFQND